ncbi:MAG: hypothetical protein U0X73_05000 [Thermoanaerobaculia bacterium]
MQESDGRAPLALFQWCAEGRSEDAWREFLDRFGPRLASAVRRAIERGGAFPTRELQEDFVQESLCRLLASGCRALRRFRGRSESEAGLYLERVAASVVADALRARRAAKRAAESGVALAEGSADRVPTRERDPEQQLLAAERRRLFLARCERLLGARPNPQRLRIVELALFEGCSSDEIAERLAGAWQPAGIDSLLSRLRRRCAAEGITVPRRGRG